MAFSSFRSASALSVAAIVLLVGGLGVAIFASQQSTENRSRADYNPADPKVGDVVVQNIPLALSDGSGTVGGAPAPYHVGNLKVGVKYKIVAKGWWHYQKNVNFNSLTDLAYDDWLQGSDGCFCHPVSDGNGGRLDFNGWHATTSDGSNPSHSYTFYWTADRDYLDVFVWDTHYHDNVVGDQVTFTMTVDSVPPPPGCKADSDCTAPQVCEVATGKCVAPPPAGPTKLNVTLLLHGIGKAGDNRNPTGEGNMDPNTKIRPVTVEFHNPTDDSIVLSKDGQATYDSAAGNFKIENLDLGTTLTTRTYKIRVITKSLRGSITRDITAAAVNTLPVMTLTNGDATYDGKLDIDDYNLIQGCVRDFDLPPSDCDGIRAAKADLDDDGTVGLFDLNLFIRELSVQNL